MDAVVIETPAVRPPNRLRRVLARATPLKAKLSKWIIVSRRFGAFRCHVRARWQKRKALCVNAHAMLFVKGAFKHGKIVGAAADGDAEGEAL